ncbi:MAG: nucleotide exchange factor GrpE [Thermoplasmata archaeon]
MCKEGQEIGASSSGEGKEGGGDNGNGEEELRKQLTAKEEELKTLRNQLLYLQADFENFRKRKEKESAELRKYVLLEFMKALLPVIDDFESMEKNLGGERAEGIAEGLRALKKNFLETLAKMGLREVEVEGFDPNLHEVEAVVPADADSKILEVVRKGYTVNGIVLRPARVVVGRKVEETSQTNTGT